MKIHRYPKLQSTNSEAAKLAESLSHGDIIITDEQTAGRGQRGNSWEAEPGKNLTFSIFLRPRELKAAESFKLSMAISIAIIKAVEELIPSSEFRIKWPNDIYWRDKKLAGILIENSFQGQNVYHSIIGIGLNVNQLEFRSDAPNPVSLAQIAGKEFELEQVLKLVSDTILSQENILQRPEKELIEKYHNLLWRSEGKFLWREPGGEPFEAEIASVAPSGHLTLKKIDGLLRSYAFKEVSPIL